MKKITECKAAGSDLAGIILINYLLSLLSLGVYFAWGKTRLRRYLWANIKIDNETLEYDGKGSELFIGYLVSAFLLLPVLAILVFIIVIAPNEKAAKGLFNTLIFLPGVFFILPFAKYRGLGYLLSRTKLRGIRFSLSGSALSFAIKNVLLALATIMTFGILFPYYRLSMWRTRINSSAYGGESLNFKGSTFNLLFIWIGALIIAVPTLGLSIFFYLAYETRYVISNTSIQDMKFNLNAGILDYSILKLTNFLLLIFTLGLAYPWVLARSLRFWGEHLVVEGELRYEKIMQTSTFKRSVGDSLLGGLQLGV